MELSEEAKEVIEYFKEKIKNKLPLYIETYIDGKPYRRNILQLETNFTEEQANKMEIVLNLIEKQQKEIEELKEDNKSYKYIIDMQNKREYRSKFLKDFQKENGKNVLPDYDEIYKRYDNQKKEIKELQEINADLVKTRIEDLQELNKIQQEDFISKDKIREKIEDCKINLEHIKNGEEFENEYEMYYWWKIALEELLEE